MKRFDGRTVIVTGGARGMGASHARGFVAVGTNLGVRAGKLAPCPSSPNSTGPN